MSTPTSKPGSSPSTAAKATVQEPTAPFLKGVELQRQVFQLPEGWLLAHTIGASELGFAFQVMSFIPPDASVQTEAVPSPRPITLMFTSTTAATNKTPRQGQAGTGSKESGRRL